MEVLRLGKVMKEKNITQTDLSRMTGLSQAYISSLVSNKKFPGKETLVLIADKLDCDIRELFHPTKRDTIQNNQIEALKKIITIAGNALKK